MYCIHNNRIMPRNDCYQHSYMESNSRHYQMKWIPANEHTARARPINWICSINKRIVLCCSVCVHLLCVFFCSLWLKVMQLRLLQLCNLLLETHLMNVWTRARHTYFPNIIVAYLFIALKRRIVVINLGLISVQPFLGVYMSMRQCNALSYSLT